MSVHPFAGFNPKPSPWGYNWTIEEQAPKASPPQPMLAHVPNHCEPAPSSPEPNLLATQLAYMPAALLSTLKREKKPFTYTPGGVNLSEVLNARLQKRIERKKKYSEDRMHPEEGMPTFDPPKQVIVMPTYNTPLDMYSMENALEVLEAQAELVAHDKSLSAPSRSATLPRNHTFRFEDKDLDPGRGVTQSKAFKVLQIITDTEQEPPSNRGRGQHVDEMRFTGIRESKAIPSKFFQTLQKITGTEGDEEEEEEERQQAVPRPAAVFEKQPSATSRPTAQPPPTASRIVAADSPQQFGSPALKRPAAFLPIKTTPMGPATGGFRPVQPPCLQNGSVRRRGRPAGGTDF